jgi:hypothetical protein
MISSSMTTLYFSIFSLFLAIMSSMSCSLACSRFSHSLSSCFLLFSLYLFSLIYWEIYSISSFCVIMVCDCVFSSWVTVCRKVSLIEAKRGSCVGSRRAR